MQHNQPAGPRALSLTHLAEGDITRAVAKMSPRQQLTRGQYDSWRALHEWSLSCRFTWEETLVELEERYEWLKKRNL